MVDCFVLEFMSRRFIETIISHRILLKPLAPCASRQYLSAMSSLPHPQSRYRCKRSALRVHNPQLHLQETAQAPIQEGQERSMWLSFWLLRVECTSVSSLEGCTRRKSLICVSYCNKLLITRELQYRNLFCVAVHCNHHYSTCA